MPKLFFFAALAFVGACAEPEAATDPRTDAGSADGGMSDATASDAEADGSTDASDSACGSALMSIEQGLAGGCRAWLDRVRGQVGQQGPGSFAVWTRRNPDRLAIVITAAHTMGAGAFAPLGQAAEERRLRPEQETEGPTPTFALPPVDGGRALRDTSPFFLLYYPGVPAEENTADFARLRPRHDFVVGVVDGQRFEKRDDHLGVLSDPLERAETPLHDPDLTTTSTPTLGEPTAGDRVMLVGYPQATGEAGGVSVGRVLSNAEAAAAVDALRAAGDPEGDIAFEPDVEMMVEAAAIAGMSGGGAFDEDGRYVGVLVRGTETDALPKYTRVVRARYIASVLLRTTGWSDVLPSL